MNEKIKSWFKSNRIWLIAGDVLLVWAIGATGIAVHYHGRYANLQSAIDDAGGSELVEHIEQQHDTIVSLQSDLGAARDATERAERRADIAERNISDAIGIGESTANELALIGDGIGSLEYTVKSSIVLQRGIIRIIEILQGNNQAVTTGY
jgi:predicted negative regulator of RcsB-dependent stress response